MHVLLDRSTKNGTDKRASERTGQDWVISQTEARPTVRPAWVATVVERLQVLVGTVILADVRDAHAALKSATTTLPSTRSTAERLVLRGVLVEFAAQVATTLHTRAHVNVRVPECSFDVMASLGVFWTPRTIDPYAAFNRWIDEFFTALDSSHPESSACRVARILRNECAESWSVKRLAARVSMTGPQLTRAFAREYGVSIRKYHHTVRLATALESIRETKVEALLVELGYRSKRTFYCAFKELTGCTPTEFRALPHDTARELVETVRLSIATRAAAYGRVAP